MSFRLELKEEEPILLLRYHGHLVKWLNIQSCYSIGKTLTAEDNRLKRPTPSLIRLVASIIGTNWNITADNWISFLKLVEEVTDVCWNLEKDQTCNTQGIVAFKKVVSSLWVYIWSHVSVVLPKKSKAVHLVLSKDYTILRQQNKLQANQNLYWFIIKRK